MKKLSAGFVVFILIFFSAGEMTRAEIPKPKAAIEGFDIESISLRDITFLFDIGITNPYPVRLKLKDIAITFYIEGNKLFTTNTSGGFAIEAKRKRTTTFRVNLVYADIMRIIQDYSRKDYLKCLADVTIEIPLPQMPGLPRSVSLNFKLNKEIPAIKPSVNIANFRVEKPSLTDVERALKKSSHALKDPKKIQGMFGDILSGKKPEKIIDPSDLDLKLRVSFDIVLKNDTRAALNFSRLFYEFHVNSSRLITGDTSTITRTGNQSVLRVMNEFSSKAMGKSLMDAFMNMRGTFSLTGYSMIKFPDAIKKEPLKLKFDEKGDLSMK